MFVAVAVPGTATHQAPSPTPLPDACTGSSANATPAAG